MICVACIAKSLLRTKELITVYYISPKCNQWGSELCWCLFLLCVRLVN